jgi:hypothetical protein
MKRPLVSCRFTCTTLCLAEARLVHSIYPHSVIGNRCCLLVFDQHALVPPGVTNGTCAATAARIQYRLCCTLQGWCSVRMDTPTGILNRSQTHIHVHVRTTLVCAARLEMSSVWSLTDYSRTHTCTDLAVRGPGSVCCAHGWHVLARCGAVELQPCAAAWQLWGSRRHVVAQMDDFVRGSDNRYPRCNGYVWTWHVCPRLRFFQCLLCMIMGFPHVWGITATYGGECIYGCVYVCYAYHCEGYTLEY